MKTTTTVTGATKILHATPREIANRVQSVLPDVAAVDFLAAMSDIGPCGRCEGRGYHETRQYAFPYAMLRSDCGGCRGGRCVTPQSAEKISGAIHRMIHADEIPVVHYLVLHNNVYAGDFATK